MISHNSIWRWFGHLFAACVVLLVAGCAATPEPVTSIPHTASFASDERPAYQLRSGDKLKLVVFGQEAISGDYVVTKDGKIDVSQVGLVDAAGLTIEQLKQHLTTKLSRGIVENPQVSLLLDTDRPVFVTGAVLSPGKYPFQPGLDARTAVALAGGYNAAADTGTIFITHAGTTDEKRYGLNDRPVINPGDVIRIPDRG